LQRQVIVRVVLSQILILQAHNGLILLIRLDVQLDQTSTGFNDQG
jgi:hypothetical protein